MIDAHVGAANGWPKVGCVEWSVNEMELLRGPALRTPLSG